MHSSSLRSIDTESGNSLRAFYESLKTPLHQQEKKQVLEAIHKLNLTVTPASVSAETGLPVLKTTALLNQIACETDGNLLVGTTGDITYKFASHFESAYIRNGAKHFARNALRIATNVFFSVARVTAVVSLALLRITIGLALICSVVLVVALIVVAIIAAIASIFKDNDAGDAGGFDLGSMDWSWMGGLRFWTIDWLWDWSWWNLSGRPRYSWWNTWDPRNDDPFWPFDDWMYNDGNVTPLGTAYGGTSKPETEGEQKEKDPDFVDSCFAVLFGAEDPNANVPALKWQIIARVIKAKQGVVTAADIEPYVEEANDRNEDWMLPILVRFNGSPEVTESGNIVYVFNAFAPKAPLPAQMLPPVATSQTDSDTASQLSSLVNKHLNRMHTKQVATQAAQAAQSLPRLLEEQPIPLNGFEPEYTKVWLFAGIAVSGPLFLMNIAHQFAFLQHFHTALVAIAIYGGLFFAAPLIRWPFVAATNTAIAERNQRRARAAEELVYPDATLQLRQKEADEIRSTLWQADTGTAYTTERDVLEQQFS